MATKTKLSPRLLAVRSHSITRRAGSGPSEEVFLTFETEWRGRKVEVVMHTDRYTASFYDEGSVAEKRFTEWRTYAYQAREDLAVSSTELTPLAKSRLGEELKPLVFEWLASDGYRNSERDAYVRLVENEAADLRPYLSEPTRDMRNLIGQYRDKLGDQEADRLRALADAYDQFAALYNEKRGMA